MNRLLSILLLALTVFTARAQTTVTWVTNATGLASLPPASTRQVVAVGNDVAGWSMWHWNAASASDTNSDTVKYSGLTSGRWFKSPVTGNATNLSLSADPTTSLGAATKRYTDTKTYPSKWAEWTNGQTIVCWGDSITGGSGVQVPYPTYLAAQLGIATYNGGVGGETSTQIKTRMLAASSRWNSPTIICAGVNNPSAYSTVTNDIGAMVGYLTTPNYFVLSLLNSDDTNGRTNGTTYNQIKAINTALAATYGTRFIDIRSMLVVNTNGSGSDATTLANDVPAASMRIDATHPNSAGNALIAAMVSTNWHNIMLPGMTNGASVGLVAEAFANPPAIGSVTPAAVSATTIAASGNITVGGNVTLGNSGRFGIGSTKFIDRAGDDSGFELKGTWYPYDTATYDLGTTSIRWRHLFLSGNATVAGNGAFSGTLDVTGNITGSGNVTLGNSGRFVIGTNIIDRATDGTGFELRGTLYPYDASTYDLGVTSIRWRNLWLSGNATATGNGSFGGTLGVTGDITASANVNLGTTGRTYYGASHFIVRTGDDTGLYLHGNWIPYASATYDIGVNAIRWRNLFLSGNATVGGNLDVAGLSTGIWAAGGTAPTCTGATMGSGSKINAGFVTTSTTGTTTCVITFPVTATTGWVISPQNNTTPNLIRQTASSTTTATFSGTTVSGDVISYIATPY